MAEDLPTDKPQLADQTVTHPEQPTEQPAEQSPKPATLEAEPVDLPVAKPMDYSKLTKAELNAELDKRGIAHDAAAKNADLEALLTANDMAKRQDKAGNQ